MLITLQKTLTDSLPLVSMNFENELSKTLKRGLLFYETSLKTVPNLRISKSVPAVLNGVR